MKYLCLVYGEEKTLDALPKADMDALVRDALAYDDVLAKSGHLIVGEALESVATATTLRSEDGELTATDGPFAETKEQLLGFILIEAGDQAEAVKLASKIPPLRIGCVEVRAVKELTAE